MENNNNFEKYSQNLIIDPSAVLMNGSRLSLEYSDPNKVYLEIGEHSLIQGIFSFEKDTGYIKVGKRSYIGGGTSISSINAIDIGDDVLIAWGCVIIDHNSHSIFWKERMNDVLQCREDYLKNPNKFIANKDWSNVKNSKITIEDKVWVGFRSSILKGVTIGEGAVIGANSVVTKNVPPYHIAAGNPAKIIREIKK